MTSKQEAYILRSILDVVGQILGKAHCYHVHNLQSHLPASPLPSNSTSHNSVSRGRKTTIIWSSKCLGNSESEGQHAYIHHYANITSTITLRHGCLDNVVMTRLSRSREGLAVLLIHQLVNVMMKARSARSSRSHSVPRGGVER